MKGSKYTYRFTANIFQSTIRVDPSARNQSHHQGHDDEHGKAHKTKSA